MIVLVMGVSGAGKTTVGHALARRLGWAFHDADDYHPPGNVERMRAGIGLEDAHRAVWLDRLAALIAGLDAAGTDAVLACSALKERYRGRLTAASDDLAVLYLHARPTLIARRLAARQGHFAGPALLASQLADLEPPGDALVLDASQPVEALVDEAEAHVSRLLSARPQRPGQSRF